jgi:hypothetical protein
MKERFGGRTCGVLLAMLALTVMPGSGSAAPKKKAAVTPPVAPSAGSLGVSSPGAASPSTDSPGSSATSTATEDSSMTIRGGQSGKEFRSMTVEGEDRVHVDFGRPELNLDLDPENVPGLTRGTALDVLDRTIPDLSTPLIALSSQERTPYLAKPWLRQFATGSVARFRPEVKGAVSWKLLVADSRGETVASFEGKGEPPHEIAWDGRTKTGALVTPGLTYSYVLEAHDRAGNKRNFVGQGFTVSAYRVDSPSGPVLVMSGHDLAALDSDGTGFGPGAATRAGISPIFLEVASWLNQSNTSREPVRVAVVARSMDQANALANRATTALSGRVIGDPARVQTVTQIAADAPEDGVLRIGMPTK